MQLIKATFACLVCLLTFTKAHAEILFHGDWANYIGPFYDETGWKNGKPLGKPTKVDGWTDFTAFWPGKPAPHLWIFNTSHAPERIQLEKDLTSPHQGVVARFEVRSGDHRRAHSGERAEMYKMLGDDYQKLPVTKQSGREFYAISVKVSKDWLPPKAEGADKWHVKWGSFMQLHSPNAFNSPPALMFTAGSKFALEMNAGELMQFVSNSRAGKKEFRKKDNQSFSFENGRLNRGQWVQFILDVLWTEDNSGHVKVYRRNHNEKNFKTMLQLSKIPTLQTTKHIPTDLVSCPSCSIDNIVHYWRVGYYRSTSPKQTNVLWLGPVVRGTDFDEVANAAFGASGLIVD